MTLSLRSLALAAGLLAVPLAVASAQYPRRGLRVVDQSGRRGFWASINVGAGSEQVDLRNGLGYSDGLTRPVIGARLGGTINQHLRLGGEVSSWINDQSGATETLTTFQLVAQVYPSSRLGLFLKGGVGIGRSEVTPDGGFSSGDTGFAGSLGAGWDIQLSRGFAIVPGVDFSQQSYSSGVGQDYRERVATATIGFAFQH